MEQLHTDLEPVGESNLQPEVNFYDAPLASLKVDHDIPGIQTEIEQLKTIPQPKVEKFAQVDTEAIKSPENSIESKYSRAQMTHLGNIAGDLMIGVFKGEMAKAAPGQNPYTQISIEQRRSLLDQIAKGSVPGYNDLSKNEQKQIVNKLNNNLSARFLGLTKQEGNIDDYETTLGKRLNTKGRTWRMRSENIDEKNIPTVAEQESIKSDAKDATDKLYGPDFDRDGKPIGLEGVGDLGGNDGSDNGGNENPESQSQNPKGLRHRGWMAAAGALTLIGVVLSSGDSGQQVKAQDSTPNPNRIQPMSQIRDTEKLAERQFMLPGQPDESRPTAESVVVQASGLKGQANDTFRNLRAVEYDPSVQGEGRPEVGDEDQDLLGQDSGTLRNFNLDGENRTMRAVFGTNENGDEVLIGFRDTAPNEDGLQRYVSLDSQDYKVEYGASGKIARVSDRDGNLLWNNLEQPVVNPVNIIAQGPTVAFPTIFQTDNGNQMLYRNARPVSYQNVDFEGTGLDRDGVYYEDQDLNGTKSGIMPGFDGEQEGRLVFDATGRIVGVRVLNNDGTQKMENASDFDFGYGEDGRVISVVDGLTGEVVYQFDAPNT